MDDSSVPGGDGVGMGQGVGVVGLCVSVNVWSRWGAYTSYYVLQLRLHTFALSHQHQHQHLDTPPPT